MNRIDRSILQLALPSVVSNITVPLLGLVDLTIVGHLGQTEAIGAIAIGTAVFNMIYWIFGFLRMGTTGLTSQAFGAQDKQEYATLLLRSLAFATLIACMLCALQYPIGQLARLLMEPSEAVTPFFLSYFNICIWGAPATLINYALTGWFIGIQNTRVPMVTAILQNCLNIAFSVFFVIYLDWGLQGVAAGTVIGLYGGMAFALLKAAQTWKAQALQRPQLKRLFHRADIRKFLSINTDIFLRTVCLVCVMTFFTYAGSHQNDTILSANALLMQFFMLFSFFMDGLANAAEALSGESQGAHDRALLRRTIRHLFGWAIALALLFTLIYLSFGIQLLELFTNQASVILTAWHYIPFVWAIPLISLMAFIWDGVFIGLCWSRHMLISMAMATVVFFLVYVCTTDTWGNNGLWLAFCCYLLSRGLAQTYIAMREDKK